MTVPLAVKKLEAHASTLWNQVSPTKPESLGVETEEETP